MGIEIIPVKFAIALTKITGMIHLSTTALIIVLGLAEAALYFAALMFLLGLMARLIERKVRAIRRTVAAG